MELRELLLRGVAPPSTLPDAELQGSGGTAEPASAPALPCELPAASSTSRPLRVVSWNIGLRGLEKMCASVGAERADVHGISRRTGFGSLSALLSALDADIICLQEVKLKELGAPERYLALLDGWDSYFALCRIQTPSTSHGRYAGVATFCRTACRPSHAEEGLTGVLAPAGAATSAVRAGGALGSADEIAARFSREACRELDGEGRCMLTVHGDLCVFNVYAPAITSEDPVQAERRAEFKAAFFEALEMRARSMLAAGLNVLIIGDLNVAPEAIDSARELQAGHSAAAAAAAAPRPSRQWLSRLLAPPAPTVPFVDAFRALHPHARGAYTCFHVAAGADAFNFGSRIDLALLAPPPSLPQPPTGDSIQLLAGADWLRQATCGESGSELGGAAATAAGGPAGAAQPLTLQDCEIDREMQARSTPAGRMRRPHRSPAFRPPRERRM